MEINGNQLINVPQHNVWDALFNPEVLKKCLPGCESVEVVSPEEFKIVLMAVVGPLKIKFKGKLLMSDVKAPNSCHMAFEGQGGVAGFGKGTADITLQTVGSDTQLTYKASAEVGGKLAQVGARLIEGVAKKIADDFFIAFRKQLSGADEPATNAEPPKKTSLKPLDSKREGKSVESIPQKTQGTGGMVPAWWLVVALFSGATIAIASGRLMN
ncbi:carbon monoxide dehydrogenase subunit G [Polynucleobacter sp. AP-Nickl1-40-C4]|jgi:carbon monoxide dehydrogenase subunit G|uniref:CoxG family protein n=1 Tax=Polynucleobacter sp. AP-Nickl1-40-C4 TaxID=3108275 RepID=UPI002B227360|nr:carbon monoxide dehydrogenase subunit G [Polynucleobacter sp. AP-Nickl1-40-C4]MEA9568963.1 carbon monoxide dehydrogenase subunit G [Polynucleobacter sp. AP-Nickl1-40-C4]